MSRSTGPLRLWCALPLAVVLGLTACSGDEKAAAPATTSAAPTSSAAETTTEQAEPTAADAAESRTVTATEGEMFIQLSEDSVTAGSVTFDVANEGSATHDFVVERDGDDVAGTESISPGSSTTLTVDLEPGEYVVYCSIGNHRQMGMEMTVTVT